MNISVMIPSRGRAAGLITCVNKLRQFASHPELVEILIKTDLDDTTLIVPIAPGPTVVLRTERLGGYWTLHHYYNAMAAISTGRWLFMLNDDAWLETVGWDDIIMQCGDGRLATRVLVPHVEWPTAPDQAHYEEYHKVKHPEFPIVSRRLYQICGHFSLSYANDTWWENIYRRVPLLLQEIPITIFHTYKREGMKPVYLNGDKPLDPDPALPNHDGPWIQRQVHWEVERIKDMLDVETALEMDKALANEKALTP